MGRLRFVADSTCDLSKDLIEKHDISVMPLCIVMGDQSYYDGVEVTPKDIFAWADENKTTPKTAAVSFEMVEKVLGPMMDAGDDIIFFGISSQMSTTNNVVRLYGEEREYSRLFVVDSMNLSTGIGLQILRAAEMAEEGKTAEEIVAAIEGARHLVRASFVVDTLTYLARGGRCTAVTALVANALKLHPMIIVKDGAMGVGPKYRGNMNMALSKYVQELMPEILKADSKRVFITHSSVAPEIAARVRETLESLNYFDEIIETIASGVISSHCGPGTLGILFYATEE